MAWLVWYLQGLNYMASSQNAMPPINAQLGVKWPSSTVQIPFNWGLMAAEAPQLWRPEMAGDGTGDGTGEGSGDCSVKSMGSELSTLPFRSCELGAPVLRSGTRVPNSASQLRKFSQRIPMSCGMVWQQSAIFAEDFLRLITTQKVLFDSL
ncbi:hypothetical protein AAG906_017148 [Vitis piasezkii]